MMASPTSKYQLEGRASPRRPLGEGSKPSRPSIRRNECVPRPRPLSPGVLPFGQSLDRSDGLIAAEVAEQFFNRAKLQTLGQSQERVKRRTGL